MAQSREELLRIVHGPLTRPSGTLSPGGRGGIERATGLLSVSLIPRGKGVRVEGAGIAGGILFLCLTFLAGSVRSQGTQSTATADPLTEIRVVERVTAAVDKSLAFLAAKQKSDGSWHENHAVNALALLAFMGRGHTPGRGPYRDILERGKRFLLSSTHKDNGYISFSSMYEHGLATLALAEMYGMDADPDLEKTLRRAVDLIIRSQSPSGGWRYQPHPGDQDLSVTVMQIVALRAANNAEIPVPAGVIDKAIRYVRSCGHQNGGYGYTAGAGPGPPTTAAGILSLQLLGKFDDPGVAKALEAMRKYPVKWDNSIQYFFYFHYYAIQASYQAGGASWNDWHPRVRNLLLEKQNSDGSWDVPPNTAEANRGVVGPNKVYWTAMASLILEIYMHFLPAYQR
jgi:hypothetical protein